jgi:HAD superfamily hydrolase (TIGR01509 family)
LIRNIIFDLGNVLLDFKPVAYLDRKYGSGEIAEKLYKEVFCSREWIELDRGTLTADEAIEQISVRNSDIAPYIKVIMNDWDEILTPIDGTIRILTELKKKGSFKLYLLSNFHMSAFLRVSEKHDFFNLFDGMVISSHLKKIKPDPEIFKHLIDSYELNPQETVFIDDVQDNTEAALKLGIGVIQFTTPEALRKELELKRIL